jgi:hypothetical protein
VSACPRYSLLCLKPQHHADPFSSYPAVPCGRAQGQIVITMQTVTFRKFCERGDKRWRYIIPVYAMTV